MVLKDETLLVARKVDLSVSPVLLMITHLFWSCPNNTCLRQ